MQRPLLPAAVLENRNKGLIKSAPSRGLIPGADTVDCVGPTRLHDEGQGCCPSSVPGTHTSSASACGVIGVTVNATFENCCVVLGV